MSSDDGDTQLQFHPITVAVAARRGAVLDGVTYPCADGTLESWVDDGPGLALPLTDDVSARFEAVRDFRHPALAAWRSLEATDGGWLALADGLSGEPLASAAQDDPGALAGWVARLVDLLFALEEAGLAHGGLAEAPMVVDGFGRLRTGPTALTRSGAADADRRAVGARVAAIARDELGTWARRLAETGDREWLVVARAWTPSGELRARYEPGDVLGQGGMGIVFRAFDRTLSRSVALKALRRDADRGDRFLREARLTARLQHPGVAPVHDVGELPSGQPFYVMEEIRGRRLDEVAHEVRGTPGGLVRLVTLYERVCETLAYAHAEGVVHRDVKPDNVMIGAFGVVRLVDWGIAAEAGRRTGPAGTPGYAAPEQWREGVADPRLDVHALGVMLDELVGEDGPRALRDLARRCASADPTARPADAEAVADEIRAWLEQRDRERRAEAAVAAADPLCREAEQAAAQARERRRRASEVLADVPSWAPVEQKQAGWELEDEADQLETAAAVARTRYEQGLRAALDHDPAHRGALDGIAALYREQLEAAEAEGRRAEAVRLSTLLADHDGGRHRAWLQGDGAVTLHTDPPGARVLLERYEEQGRRLVPVPQGALGTTPLDRVPLARGSWCLRVVHPERAEVRYPVAIARGEHWDGVPPEGGDPQPIPLPARDELGPDEVYVPAGWFVSGDPAAPDGLPRRRLWIDGLVVDRYPVTVARYLEFLEAARASGTLDDAWIPRAPQSGGGRPIFEPGPRGWVRTGGAEGPYALEPDWPIVAVPWTAAVAYAGFRGEGWRLLHDQEWEKAARGTDGRTYPWGNRLDGTFARSAESQPDTYLQAPVFSHPMDVSAYGIRGMAGNVRDWTSNGYARQGGPGPRPVRGPGVDEQPLRIIRGGAYFTVGRQLRTASRFVLPYDRFAPSVGIRLARAYGATFASVSSK